MTMSNAMIASTPTIVQIRPWFRMVVLLSRSRRSADGAQDADEDPSTSAWSVSQATMPPLQNRQDTPRGVLSHADVPWA